MACAKQHWYMGVCMYIRGSMYVAPGLHSTVIISAHQDVATQITNVCILYMYPNLLQIILVLYS